METPPPPPRSTVDCLLPKRPGAGSQRQQEAEQACTCCLTVASVPRSVTAAVLACRESRRVSREAAARILALKDRDYAEYLRLARNTKDKRLRTLLDKTDAIISDLGIKVAGFAHGLLLPRCVCRSIFSVLPGPCPATATDCLSHKHFREGPRDGACARSKRPCTSSTWCTVQVQDQRVEVIQEGTGVGMWLDGAENGRPDAAAGAPEDDIDEETRHLLLAQQHYYDSVHVVKEQARAPPSSGLVVHHKHWSCVGSPACEESGARLAWGQERIK